MYYYDFPLVKSPMTNVLFPLCAPPYWLLNIPISAGRGESFPIKEGCRKGGGLMPKFSKIPSSVRCPPTKKLKLGLDKLCARLRACMQRARKEVFTCTKLCARKSIKTPVRSTPMLFKVASFFYVWKQIIFGTIRSDTHNLFRLRSCC